MKKTKNDKLFEIAEAQQGYFTAKQAQPAGFLATNYTYYVQVGILPRNGSHYSRAFGCDSGEDKYS